MDESFETRRPVRAADVVVICTLLFGLLACAIGANKVPVQDWWSSRGPVVPHDTFPADCSLCHTGSDWNTIREDFAYDHEANTGVALTGAHARAECLRCHNDRGPVQTFAAKGCAGCHENVHRGQLGDGCADCHTETDWRPKEQIAQHARTGFPLVGAHAATACWRCHSAAQEGIFSGASTECSTCHAAELASATNPDHLAQGWVDDCSRCHSPTAWSGASFVHSTFPLSGAHASTDCAMCHVGNVFTGTPNDCVDCHLPEYQGVVDPLHTLPSFPTTCDSCHTTSNWNQASFDHTSFPLTGAHQSADCASCHGTGVFAGTPNDCSDCHLAEYQGATSPLHTQPSFPLTCQACHSTMGWQPASFNHSSFPLLGAHAATDCAACHTGGVFAGTPTDCVACHLSDYQTTNSPNHANSGFPTACDACHSSIAWEPANFDHDFPINSGKHKNFDCADCHTTPSNFNVFSCTTCHEHNKNDTDDHHDDVQNYVYATSACYQCHPDGKED